MKGLVSLRLEKELLESIDRIAKEEGKSRSAIIKEAVRLYIKHNRSVKESEFVVSFLEYKELQSKLISAMERITELELQRAELLRENKALKEKCEKNAGMFRLSSLLRLLCLKSRDSR